MEHGYSTRFSIYDGTVKRIHSISALMDPIKTTRMLVCRMNASSRARHLPITFLYNASEKDIRYLYIYNAHLHSDLRSNQ
jgi:hypothetical protein